MAKRKTTSQFIEDAVKVHGDKYDYSKVNYISCKDKVEIICKVHGSNFQTPSNHLKGQGCQRCYDLKRAIRKIAIKEKRANPTETSTENFIRKAVLKHNDNFDYSLVDYRDAKSKVKIICNKNKHIFEQSPSNHLHGFGCILCARITQGDSKRLNQEIFIKKSTEVHGNTYCYDDTEYIQANKKVTIECRHHGKFTQSPNAHMAGKGCEKCAILNNSFSRTDYIRMAKGKPTTLYLIRCFNKEESFYKIGKTFQKVSERYRKGSLPYDYELLSEYISTPECIFDLEILTHRKYARYSYTPSILFGGYTECYIPQLPIQEIINLNSN